MTRHVSAVNPKELSIKPGQAGKCGAPLQPHRHQRHGVTEVGSGDDGMHAGHLLCVRDIDSADAAVGDRATQDRRVQHVFTGKIVDILAAAATALVSYQSQPPVTSQGSQGGTKCHLAWR